MPADDAQCFICRAAMRLHKDFSAFSHGSQFGGMIKQVLQSSGQLINIE